MKILNLFYYPLNLPDSKIFFLYSDSLYPPEIMLMFLYNRIVITGSEKTDPELLPDGKGVISKPGVSLDWFLNASRIQLGIYFLDKEFFPAQAKADLQKYLDDLENETLQTPDICQQKNEIQQIIEDAGEFMFDSPEYLRDHLSDYFPGEPINFGWTYYHEDLDLLVGIQTIFKQLYFNQENLK